MPHFARPWGRHSRRRPAPARYSLEPLEERAMLSGTAAAHASSQAHISTQTILVSSLNTAVSGADVTFAAVVHNASTHAPIDSGKVDFVIESPQKTLLGAVALNKQGVAGITTTDLTRIGDYSVGAQFIPSKSNISPSVASPINVKVIPVPLNVPTVTTVESGASVAELGQNIPLVATVKDAGTGVQVDAGLVEPLTGTVAFLTNSPSPIVLGEASVNSSGRAFLSTSLLKNLGPNQIVAEFLPANNYFAESTSAPVSVTITSQTTSAPTVTTLQVQPSTIETGEPVALTATVQNSNSDLAQGVVKFVTVSRRPVVLGEVKLGLFGQPVAISSFKLEKVGSYQVVAKYLPNTTRFAASTSAPVTVTVTPLTAASFRVTPVVGRGHLGEPLGFTVTALDARKQPFPNYTGTVVFFSPTASPISLNKALVAELSSQASAEGETLGLPPASPTSVSFVTPSYTFTPADHGTHTFQNEVIFAKGGAESVEVTQSNNAKVFGKTTFAIG
jgi:Bacterial Ig-like domain (group 3)